MNAPEGSLVRRVGFATVAAATLAAAGQPVSAADVARVPTKAPIAGPTPVHNWTGVYGGASAGYSWGRSEIDYTLGGIPAISTTLDPNSFVAGGQVGYNWQLGSVVVGVEGDVAWRHGSDSATFTVGAAFASFDAEQNWVATLRPRIGFAANNWLIYGTGGAAFGQLGHSYTESVGGAARSVSDSDTKAGWTAGGGVEYAFQNQWSLGVEYLFLDFGSTTLTQPGAGAFPPSSTTFDDKSHLLRAKVNYKFNWTTPLAPAK
jgi:outer membrane immunogenic protein